MPVTQISINLDRSSAVYYAGEVIRGKVTFEVAGSAVNCRGAHIRFQGKSRIHWHTGSGDNRSDFDGTTIFVSQRQTLYGNFYKTALLDNAGADAIFGKVHGDGVLHIPCTELESQASLPMILRVMDYDWGKRDDLLGEQVIDLAEMAKSRQVMRYDLTRFGEPESGQVILSCKFVPKAALYDTPDSAASSQTGVPLDTVCIVQVHSAKGLRKADWFGRNDVYVQLYRLDPGASRRFRDQLPKPDKNTVLATGRHTFGFAFSVPSDSPGSAELKVSDYAYVRYDLYANVDIKMWKDPSRKVAVSIIPNRPAPTRSLLGPAVSETIDEAIYGCDCCGRCCKLDGLVSAVLQTDRRAYAPGESVDLRRSYVHNSTSKPLPVVLELRQAIIMSTGRLNRSVTKSFVMAQTTCPANSRLDMASFARDAKVPIVFPSFNGGINKEPEDWPRRYVSLKWSYVFILGIEAEGCCPSAAVGAVPVLITSAPPFGNAIRDAASQGDFRMIPNMDAFSVMSDGVFDSTPTSLMPHITGPEDGGLPTAAAGLEGGVFTYEVEDNGNIGASNPTYVPMVNAFATDGGANVAVEADSEPDIPLAPAVIQSGDTPSESFITLLASMKDSYDKRQIVGEWIRDHPGEAGGLTPSQVAEILKQVTFSLDQPSVAGEIAVGFERFNTLTCQHILFAMEACGFNKADVAKVMAPFAVDPESKSMVLDMLDYEFEKSDVEKLFRG